MIPHSREFDVFVSEGALVEVWRGEHVSVAQQFGVDWDGPSHSVMHAAVFADPNTPPATEMPPPAPEVSRVRRAWRWLCAAPWHVWLCVVESGIGFSLCVALAVGAVLAWGMARGWW